VIPVTWARKDVDVYPSDYLPLNKMDSVVHNDCKLTVQYPLPSWISANDLDDAELLDGAPVGLQIVGQRLQEETVLGLSEEISRELARVQVARL
jgi:hypothetical protein